MGEAVKRESQSQFWERVSREGRQTDAESRRHALTAEGRAPREVRRHLVAEFQPLDGSRTVAYETPNRWEKKGKEPDRKKLVGHRKIVEWVWEHMSDAKPPRAPSGKAKALLDWAKEHQGEFLKEYVPLLVKGSKEFEEKERTEENIIGKECMKRLDDCLLGMKREHGIPPVGESCQPGKCRWMMIQERAKTAGLTTEEQLLQLCPGSRVPPGASPSEDDWVDL